jgi:hypothetical protein
MRYQSPIITFFCFLCLTPYFGEQRESRAKIQASPNRRARESSDFIGKFKRYPCVARMQSTWHSVLSGGALRGGKPIRSGRRRRCEGPETGRERPPAQTPSVRGGENSQI